MAGTWGRPAPCLAPPALETPLRAAPPPGAEQRGHGGGAGPGSCGPRGRGGVLRATDRRQGRGPGALASRAGVHPAGGGLSGSGLAVWKTGGWRLRGWERMWLGSRDRDSAGAEVPQTESRRETREVPQGRKRRCREARRRAKKSHALSPAASPAAPPGSLAHNWFLPKALAHLGSFAVPRSLQHLGYTSVKAGVELWCMYFQASLPHHPCSILKDRAQHLAEIQLIV